MTAVALFAFEQDGDEINVVSEKHYQLVPPDAVTDEDLAKYRQRLSENSGSVQRASHPSAVYRAIATKRRNEVRPWQHGKS